MYGAKYHNIPFDLSELSDHTLVVHMRNLPRSRYTNWRLQSGPIWRPLVGWLHCSETRQAHREAQQRFKNRGGKLEITQLHLHVPKDEHRFIVVCTNFAPVAQTKQIKRIAAARVWSLESQSRSSH
ncbi:hypothetical protein, unlikely [Trypanosoma congolense IL3000]|uniref:Uncharacterized protein n=1 Tax=Trypanosoma congolense (strain IL3000) TaxID=1068625 RepID=F9WBT9_TRYCI|nr:hypothetical protein, unlikely [Trypanosoma congolense IL3000]